MIEKSSRTGRKYVSVHLRFEEVLMLISHHNLSKYLALLCFGWEKLRYIECLLPAGHVGILMLCVWWRRGRKNWNGFSSWKRMERKVQTKRSYHPAWSQSNQWKMPTISLGGTSNISQCCCLLDLWNFFSSLWFDISSLVYHFSLTCYLGPVALLKLCQRVSSHSFNPTCFGPSSCPFSIFNSIWLKLEPLQGGRSAKLNLGSGRGKEHNGVVWGQKKRGLLSNL